MIRPVALIQARMGSTRLPGKVLTDVAGTTVLAHVVERVRACRGLAGVRIATTTSPADEAIVAEAVRLGVQASRGSEHDVLERFVQAAQDADWIVRVTADCPLFDPLLLEAMIARAGELLAGGSRVDYLANGAQRGWPRGLDAEIVRMEALRRAHREARRPYEREHVTPYLWRRPDRFSIAQLKQSPDLSDRRWTVDTPEDFEFVSRVFYMLYPTMPLFGQAEVESLAIERLAA